MRSLKFVISLSALTVGLSVVIISCKKDNVLQSSSLDQAPNLPSTTYDYAKKHNVQSDMATLGRVLFYDKNLSVTNH